MRVVFLCGDRSPYGRAHTAPLAGGGFELAAVVVADDARWRKFARALAGRAPPVPPARARLKAALGGRGYAEGWAPFRRFNPTWDAGRRALAAAGTPVIELHDVNHPDAVARLGELAPDLLISAAYPQIFRDALLALPPRGCVNFHPSLLPEFRGAHPHFWAIATGAPRTGVTAHFMTPELDAGDILAQRGFDLGEMRYSELYARLIAETGPLVAEVEAFFAGGGAARPQDPAAATTFRADREIHRRLDWAGAPPAALAALCRTERAFTFLGAARVGVVDAALREGNRNMTNGVRAEAGVVVDIRRGAVVVATREPGSFLAIREVAAGGPPEAAAAWAARAGVTVGVRLG